MTYILVALLVLTRTEETKVMRINQVIAIVFGALLISGCGDQVWCGENGCGASRDVSTPSAPINLQNNSILENML